VPKTKTPRIRGVFISAGDDGRIAMPQPKLSNLLRGRFRGFSERRLMDCLTKLGRDVQIVVKATPRSRREGRLSIVFA
jgi:hypothetical protein